MNKYLAEEILIMVPNIQNHMNSICAYIHIKRKGKVDKRKELDIIYISHNCIAHPECMKSENKEYRKMKLQVLK